MSHKIKKHIWILPLGWMLLIFIFSHQPGNESAELSGGITQLILNLFGAVNIRLDETVLHGMIRSIAHFTIFFILGQLWYITLRFRDIPASRSALVSFAICFSYALFDEAHQYFVPGRACELKDVMMDSLGAGLAIAIGWLISGLNEEAPI